MRPEWITAVATAGGSILVVGQLGRAIRQAHKRNERQRRENTITIYLETLDSRRRIKGEELPDDRDEEAIAAFIAELIEAEKEGREREERIASRRHALTQYLNFWEAVALGVEQGVFDLDTLNKQAGGHIASLWCNYQPWVESREEKFGEALYRRLRWLGVSSSSTGS